MERRQRNAPRYKIVADALRDRIGPEFAVDDELPSLQEIEDEYQVTRDIARRALTDLQLAGLISKQHGVRSRVLALPGDPLLASPEAQKVMQLIGALQQQVDELADQVAEIREKQGLPPRRSDLEADAATS